MRQDYFLFSYTSRSEIYLRCLQQFERTYTQRSVEPVENHGIYEASVVAKGSAHERSNRMEGKVLKDET